MMSNATWRRHWGPRTRAAALTHRLLAFSRRQTLDPKSTDVNRLVSDSAGLDSTHGWSRHHSSRLSARAVSGRYSSTRPSSKIRC